MSEGLMPLLSTAEVAIAHEHIGHATRRGQNARIGINQIGASNDLEAIAGFLSAKSRCSLDTQRMYRKEARRFVAWLAIERNMSVSEATSEDLRLYEGFLANPQPAERWVGKRGRRSPSEKATWTPPFAGPLSPPSISSSMTILRAMFSFLTESGYLLGNPFVAFGTVAQVGVDEQGRIYRKDRDSKTRNSIEPEDKDDLLFAIELLPRETAKDVYNYHRLRWVMNLLLLTGLRRSEAAEGRMGDITKQRDGWFLRVIGKGRRERMVPMPPRLVSELMVYRQSLGMSAMPALREVCPLVVPQRKRGGNMGAQEIYRTVKRSIEHLEVLLTERGDFERAMSVKKISAHWLRHTFAKSVADSTTDIRSLQSIMGHKDINTTMNYAHQSAEQQMAAVVRAFEPKPK